MPMYRCEVHACALYVGPQAIPRGQLPNPEGALSSLVQSAAVHAANECVQTENLCMIPSEARLYPLSIDIFHFSSSSSSSSTRSWPKNFDISRMVYGITIRLAGMKALVAAKQQ